jgi:hypothetical protein
MDGQDRHWTNYVELRTNEKRYKTMVVANRSRTEFSIDGDVELGWFENRHRPLISVKICGAVGLSSSNYKISIKTVSFLKIQRFVIIF